MRENLNLLDGIHPETVEILGTRNIGHMALRVLRKVSAVRQIEMAELMVAANTFSSAYAKALFVATPEEMLTEKVKVKKHRKLDEADAARMGEEMKQLEGEFKAAEESYGENIVNLTIAKGFVKKLLDNARVVRWLTNKSPDVLKQFEQIVATDAL